MTASITGHRPNKLYGYNLKHPKYEELKTKFKELLQKYRVSTAYTGMALGVDTIFAQAVLELKKEDYPIRLSCVLPCARQESKWSKIDQKRYHEILQQADEVVRLSEDDYRPELMRIRNRWLVDHANFLIAVWDGSDSGTSNCVQYAIPRIPVYRIQP